jgi:hypothetical protein
MTRWQWLIKGVDAEGRPLEVHHHGWRSIAGLPGHLGVLHRSSRWRHFSLGANGDGLQTRPNTAGDGHLHA